VTVDLSAGRGTGGEAAGDSLTGIETLVGSAYTDVLTGDGSANLLQGGGSYDNLDGGAGADTLDGGSGSDWAFYARSTAGVTVNLATGATGGGDAQGDVLISMENVVGSDYDDVLTG